MKKRILSLIIVAIMLFQIQPIFAVDGEFEVDFSHYIKCEDLLEALSIVESGKNYEETITRGQAAYNLASLLNETDNFQPYRGIFSDVDSSNENALAIEKLADLGIVRGSGNFCYNPDGHLTYNEAVIMFMNALGYGLVNEQNNYNEATKLGILNNIQAEYDVVNMGDFYVMMYNALFASPVVQTSYGTEVEYQKSEQTMLYKLYDVVYADGVVVKNDYTYLWSDKDITEDSIVVRTAKSGDIEIFPADITKVRNDLGKNIRVYFTEDKESGKYIYVYHTVREINNILTITLDQVEPGKVNFAQRKFAYYKEGDSKLTTISLANDYNLIYNNVVYKGDNFDFSTISDKSGNITLIDANGDRSYDTIVIKAYKNYIVENISLTYGYLTDKYNNEKLSIDAEAYDKIFIYNAAGETIKTSDIGVGNVVSAAVSESNSGSSILEIHVSQDVRNGKITRYKNEGSRKYIIFDGDQKYYLYDRADDVDYKANTAVLVYFDAFGNIVYITDDTTRDMQYGILFGVNTSGNSLASDVKVRLITSSGEFVETKLSKNAIIDGVKLDNPGKKLAALEMDYTYKNSSNEYVGTYFGKTSLFSKRNIKDAKGNYTSATTEHLTIDRGIIPVRYSLNDAGEVKALDTVFGAGAEFDKNGKLVTTASSGEGTDCLEIIDAKLLTVTGGQMLGHKIPYTSDATVIHITGNEYTNKNSLMDKSTVKSTNVATAIKLGKDKNLIALKSNKDSEYADFLIIFEWDIISSDSLLVVVDEVIEAYNDARGETMYLLTGYENGIYKEYWVKNLDDTKDVASYKKGDIIRPGFDFNNNVVDFEEIYKRDNKFVFLGYGMRGINTESSQGLACIGGYVKSRNGMLLETSNYIGATTLKTYPVPEIDSSLTSGKWSDDTLVTNITDASVTVFDESEGRIFKGSVEDIRDYDTFGEDASHVIIRFRSYKVTDVYVYNK